MRKIYNIEWVKTEVDDPYNSSCVSKNTYYGLWKIVAFQLVRYKEWNIEIPCTCLTRCDFRQNVSAKIPDGRNSIVAVCNECETPMVRFAGFQTGKWELYVNKELEKNGR